MSKEFGNVPLPVRCQADTMEEALHAYQVLMLTMFQDAQDAGHPMKVHTLQIIPPHQTGVHSVCTNYTVVAFIMEDESEAMRQLAMDAINRGNKLMQSAECEHEYGDGMKCIHCGSVL